MKEQVLSTRPATVADLDYVWNVYKEAVRPHIEPQLKHGWIEATEFSNFSKSWKQADTHIILIDGVSIGWGGVDLSGTDASIEHLYIEPAHRGKGYGTRLVSELLLVWEAEGKAVHAPILKGSPAIGAVIRLGFGKRSDSQLPLVELLTFKAK